MHKHRKSYKHSYYLLKGYYCPTGSSSRTEQACPAGHYCAGGNSAGVFCESGYYQDETGKSTCKICPPGMNVCCISQNHFDLFWHYLTLLFLCGSHFGHTALNPLLLPELKSVCLLRKTPFGTEYMTS